MACDVGTAHPGAGLLRVSRAAVLGSVAFVLALSAHVAAGGRAPSMATSLMLALSCAFVCFVLTSRRLGLVALATTLGVLQLVLHCAFVWFTPGVCVTVSPSGGAAMRMSGGPAQVLIWGPR